MKKILSFLWALLLFIPESRAQQAKPWIIAYYTGDESTIEKYPVASLTHVIYSFLQLEGDTLAFKHPAQEAVLRKLVALKQRYPSLKVLVSLGGWGGCKPCSEVFSNAVSRDNFAASVVRLLKAYGADGIDLDWEYPGIEGHPGHPWKAGDVPNFTALVESLRTAMGNGYILSFAAGGFTKFLENSVDWEKVMPKVDMVNLMTYDLVNGYSKVTGHHTALNASAAQPEATDHCVEFLLKRGVPAGKLVIGAAFYARVWKDVPSVNNGLFQPGVFKTSISYRDFPEALSVKKGFRSYWDDSCQAPYSYNEKSREFATYDNERSIEAKTRYLRQKGLGGIMFWELTLDKYSNGLVEKIADGLK